MSWYGYFIFAALFSFILSILIYPFIKKIQIEKIIAPIAFGVSIILIVTIVIHEYKKLLT
jgi:phosphoglycerol transferase MdoB-like AlkP superfamily enzyme